MSTEPTIADCVRHTIVACAIGCGLRSLARRAAVVSTPAAWREVSSAFSKSPPTATFNRAVGMSLARHLADSEIEAAAALCAQHHRTTVQQWAADTRRDIALGRFTHAQRKQLAMLARARKGTAEVRPADGWNRRVLDVLMLAGLVTIKPGGSESRCPKSGVMVFTATPALATITAAGMALVGEPEAAL